MPLVSRLIFKVNSMKDVEKLPENILINWYMFR